MEQLITLFILLSSCWFIPWLLLIARNFFAAMLHRKRTMKGELFDNTYIDIKNFYLQEFRTMPCVTFIQHLKVEAVFDYISEGNAGEVTAVYQSNYFDWRQKKIEASRTVFKLENRVIIELGYDHARIVFDDNNYDYVDTLSQVFADFRSPEKAEAFEINIITLSNNYLELKPMEIKQTTLDLSLYYNEDFLAVDEMIRLRLNREEDKGIILLHGLPGTGKTTYLRHLIGQLKKKVLFVSPAVAENLMNPEFVDLLIDNPNAVLVIEDAENVINDRRFNTRSGVSNLLNISDGLLSDCLNVQIICTFNNALSHVDEALLRKGRLIAKYEFGKLEVSTAQALSDHLGLTQKIDHPMTLAEISNPSEEQAKQPETRVIGFRRETVMN